MRLLELGHLEEEYPITTEILKIHKRSQVFSNGPITFKHFNNVTVLIVWTVALLKYLTVISTFANRAILLCSRNIVIEYSSSKCSGSGGRPIRVLISTKSKIMQKFTMKKKKTEHYIR